jgi:site-specific DNA-methyltransferase (adenine-specific)
MNVGQNIFEKNKIYFGDGLEGMKIIPDKSVDLIVTDPPYGKLIKKDWDSKNGVNIETLNEYYRILKDTGSIYIFCGIGEKSNSLLENLNLISQTNLIFKDLITWKKQKGYGAKRGWLYTREEIIWLVKDNKKYFWNIDNQYDLNKKRNYKRKIGKSWFKRYTNVWDDIKETLFDDINKDRIDGMWYDNLNKTYPVLHQTIKPVAIIDRILQAHTKPNENYLVVDTFAGSSTTAISSIKNKCDYIMFEKEEQYYNLSLKRVGDFLNSFSHKTSNEDEK